MMDILVIEDDLRVSELIKRGLEEQGFSATVAYDGVMGKKLALQHPYELIITDIILPKMDGLELCKQLREANLEIPIIMLTALGTTDDKLEGFDAGADDYLVKPFEIRELMARIQVLLKRQSKNIQTYSNVLKYDELELNLQNKTVKRGSRYRFNS
jgi:DNA-binding response OmpR family regulator